MGDIRGGSEQAGHEMESSEAGRWGSREPLSQVGLTGEASGQEDTGRLGPRPLISRTLWPDPSLAVCRGQGPSKMPSSQGAAEFGAM